MSSSTPLRDSAFISYSHKDRALLEQFQAHLKPLIVPSAAALAPHSTIKHRS